MTVQALKGDHGFPAARTDFFDTDIAARLGMEGQPPVRILLLYGSLRERSYSRLLVEEAARLLQTFGAETRIFDPRGLPHADDIDVKNHPKVKRAARDVAVVRGARVVQPGAPRHHHRSDKDAD